MTARPALPVDRIQPAALRHLSDFHADTVLGVRKLLFTVGEAAGDQDVERLADLPAGVCAREADRRRGPDQGCSC